MTPPGIPGIPNQIPEFRSWIVHRSLSWEVRAKEPCGQPRIEIRESDSGFRGFWEGCERMSMDARTHALTRVKLRQATLTCALVCECRILFLLFLLLLLRLRPSLGIRLLASASWHPPRKKGSKISASAGRGNPGPRSRCTFGHPTPSDTQHLGLPGGAAGAMDTR